jgi:hypothetical protein
VQALSNFPRLGLLYSGLADFVVLLHLAFIAFALMGGMLVSRWPSIAWIHVPSVAWIALNQSLGWNCPLTLVEHWSRQRAGTGEYEGNFILHYLAPVLGSDGRRAEPLGGLVIILLNGALYFWIAARSRQEKG